MSESARIKILTTVIMKRKRDGKRFASFRGITNESVIVNITRHIRYIQTDPGRALLCIPQRQRQHYAERSICQRHKRFGSILNLFLYFTVVVFLILPHSRGLQMKM